VLVETEAARGQGAAQMADGEGRIANGKTGNGTDP
jgi:hypothetical protein